MHIANELYLGNALDQFCIGSYLRQLRRPRFRPSEMAQDDMQATDFLV